MGLIIFNKLKSKLMRTSLLLLILLSLLRPANAQVSCASFCITNIQIEPTIPGMIAVTVAMSGTTNDVAMYPVITALIDTAGDTVATGTLNFFLQYGGTTQDYLMNSSMTVIPPNFTCIAYFMYDSINCILTYPCVINGIAEHGTNLALNISPNPAGDFINFEIPEDFKNGSLEIFNASGQMIRKEAVELKIRIDVKEFIPGIYICRYVHPKGRLEGKFKKE